MTMHQWEFNSLCQDVTRKQAMITKQKAIIQRLEQIIRQWAMRLNVSDPQAAALMLDDLVDARIMAEHTEEKKQ
jgi:hypothetical protein